MRKIITAINITIDGFCDHTAMIADDELHQHYTELLNNAGTVLYGRITFQLMESYWPTVVKNPTGNKAHDDFAIAIENVPKIVFSRTLDSVKWQNTTLTKRELTEEVLALKEKPGKDVFVGSPSLIASLTQLGLIDEYQLCIHPVILGNGLPLFKNMADKFVLKLLRTKTFGSGTVLHCYASTKNNR